MAHFSGDAPPRLGGDAAIFFGVESCARNIAAGALDAMPRRSDVGAERVRRSTASEMSAQRPQTMPSASARVPADASRTWLPLLYRCYEPGVICSRSPRHRKPHGSALEGRDLELSVSPKGQPYFALLILAPTARIDDNFGRGTKFESNSVQRRVCCEPDSIRSGCRKFFRAGLGTRILRGARSIAAALVIPLNAHFVALCIPTAIGADYLVRVGKQPDLSERRTAAVLWPRSPRGLAPD